MPSSKAAKKFFQGRKFFIYMRKLCKVKTQKAGDLIKLFGGQIELFLESGISYVLTDIPKNEWPPDGNDQTLVRAKENNIKLMAYDELISWCSKYLQTQSSSDDEDDQATKIRRLQAPYIKAEDYNCFYTPWVRELSTWPKLNLNDLTLGKPIFCDNNINGSANNSLTNYCVNNSAQITPQAASLKSTNNTSNNINNVLSNSTHTRTPIMMNINGFHNSALPIMKNINQSISNNIFNITNNNSSINNVRISNQLVPMNAAQQPTSQQNLQQITSTRDNRTAQRGVKRKHSVQCEICNIRLTDRIEDHILTESHRINTEKIDWSEINYVIDSLPSFSTLNRHRLSDLSIPKGIEYQEFVCLHKMDSVSQLFHTFLDR